MQVSRQGDLERSSSRNERLVLDGVLDRSESVSESVVDLGDGVLVGSCERQNERGRKRGEDKEEVGLA